jgi:hypothetical protein
MRKLTLCTFALCLGFASITHAAPTVTKLKFKGNTASGGRDLCENLSAWQQCSAYTSRCAADISGWRGPARAA